MATDGTIIEPTPAELAAAANASRPWLGCIVARNVIMSGQLVAVLDGLARVEDCCRRARADERANLYNYCPSNRTEACRCAAGRGAEQGSKRSSCTPQQSTAHAALHGACTAGRCSCNTPLPPAPLPPPPCCSYSYGPRSLTLQPGQCELRFNAPVSPPIGFPPGVVAKGPNVPFLGGAPLMINAPPVDGYTTLVGRNQFDYNGGSFNCSFTLKCAGARGTRHLAALLWWTVPRSGVLRRWLAAPNRPARRTPALAAAAPRCQSAWWRGPPSTWARSATRRQSAPPSSSAHVRGA